MPRLVGRVENGSSGACHFHPLPEIAGRDMYFRSETYGISTDPVWGYTAVLTHVLACEKRYFLPALNLFLVEQILFAPSLLETSWALAGLTEAAEHWETSRLSFHSTVPLYPASSDCFPPVSTLDSAIVVIEYLSGPTVQVLLIDYNIAALIAAAFEAPQQLPLVDLVAVLLTEPQQLTVEAPLEWLPQLMVA